MNYHIAMQEAYTTSNVTRAAWSSACYVWKGAIIWDKPFYEADGETISYTLPCTYTGYIKRIDGIDNPYSPTDDDEQALDWDYWNPVF